MISSLINYILNNKNVSHFIKKIYFAHVIPARLSKMNSIFESNFHVVIYLKLNRCSWQNYFRETGQFPQFSRRKDPFWLQENPVTCPAQTKPISTIEVQLCFTYFRIPGPLLSRLIALDWKFGINRIIDKQIGGTETIVEAVIPIGNSLYYILSTIMNY